MATWITPFCFYTYSWSKTSLLWSKKEDMGQRLFMVTADVSLLVNDCQLHMITYNMYSVPMSACSVTTISSLCSCLYGYQHLPSCLPVSSCMLIGVCLHSCQYWVFVSTFTNVFLCGDFDESVTLCWSLSWCLSAGSKLSPPLEGHCTVQRETQPGVHQCLWGDTHIYMQSCMGGSEWQQLT